MNQVDLHLIKSKLVTAPIMLKPNWNNDYEIMCDAGDYAMGAVLGQIIENNIQGHKLCHQNL